MFNKESVIGITYIKDLHILEISAFPVVSEESLMFM